MRLPVIDFMAQFCRASDVVVQFNERLKKEVVERRVLKIDNYCIIY